MSTVFFLKIPSSDQVSVDSGSIQDRLALAVQKGVTPRPLPVARMRRQRQRLSPDLENAVSDIAQKHGLAVSDAASGLLYGLWVQEQKSSSRPARSAAPANEHFLRGLRPGQKPLAKAAIEGVLSGRFVLAEGSTGIGKSRVLVRTALAWLLKNRSGKVVICAPSLNVLSQIILNEWASDPDGQQYNASLVVGRGQFISPGRIQSGLPEMGENGSLDEITRWVDSGGQPRVSAVAAAFRALGLPAAWLADDLAEIAPQVPISAYRLTAGDRLGEDAESIYAGMLKRAERSRVIFTTQSSVLADARLRAFGHGFLPGYDCLLIDEAHEMESIASDILSDGLSFQGARLRLLQAQHAGDLPHGCKAVIKRLIDQLEEAMDRFKGRSPGASAWMSQDDPDVRWVRQCLARMIPEMEKLHAKSFDLGYVSSALAAARQALNPDRERFAMLRFTGVRGYPVVEAGFHSLKAIIRPIWDSLDAGGLFSATLFTSTREGRFSSAYIRSALHLPADRTVDIAPAHASWALDNVSLHLPQPGRCASLTPPGMETLDTESLAIPALSAYHSALASQITEVISSATGGVLVLFTAYRELHGVAALLKEDFSSRLVVQSRGESAQALRARFLALSEPGVWLGTGAAWTGLDLTGENVEPREDKTLTDLVVTRLPAGHGEVGLVAAKLRSLPSLQRMFLDFKLRQGIGRTVRHPEHQGRRVWILDPRITSTQPPAPWLTALARRTLRRYKKTHYFDTG